MDLEVEMALFAEYKLKLRLNSFFVMIFVVELY
jgi:hypothetical protein